MSIEIEIVKVKEGYYTLFGFPEKIVYTLEVAPCVQFFEQYPKVKVAMMAVVTTKKCMAGYKKFLKYINANEDKFDARAETINSPYFGSKTFYYYDFPPKKERGGGLGFAELYQYLYLKSRKLI